MTTDIIKMNKIKQDIINFLNNHRYKEDDEIDKATHNSYGNLIKGKFYIDKKDMKEFMNLYILAIENKIYDFSILEVQKEYSPIIIDIDLKSPIEDYKNNERLYTDELIMNIISKYISIIEKYLIIDKNNFTINIFEKKKAVTTDDLCKDGFHIMFPSICIKKNLRELIRHEVVELCKTDNIFDIYLESADKIIDKAVVYSNGWFLYGSRKPGGQLYTLTYSYDYDFNEINIDNPIKYFSLHIKQNRYSEKCATPLKNNYNDSDINVEISKLGITNTNNNNENKFEISENKDILINRAIKYVSMLDDTRSENYEDWRNVGLALHNIDDSLLSTWLEFSEKCPKKYNEGYCYKFWKQFKTPSSGNLLTIRSLAYWAKIDNPKEYQKYIELEFKKTREESIEGSTYKIAKSFYSKYSDRFCYTQGLWREYKNHRWNLIEDGYTIKILLSEEFQNDYLNDMTELTIKATRETGYQKEQISARITSINKIIEKLNNIDFKKKIIEECKSLFLDTKFNEKLNSNKDLIGFENGVYDLNKKIFRDGHPDDFLSFSTKNTYIKFSERMPYLNDILKFLSQILPNEIVRSFFRQALSICISGDTKEEKIFFLTGCGSNGKSLVMELMKLALGEYYMACPISMLTKKRGNSNETSPEKVRMHGRRCGVFQETDEGDKLNVGIMKELTGGDSVLVRDLFKGSEEMLEFKPQMKLFLTCNQLPTVPSIDEGTWRRICVIDFNSKFVDNPTKPNEFKINLNLKQEIKKWANTFISYLIYIYEKEYNQQLIIPDEVKASTCHYKLDNDFYTEYVVTKLIITNNLDDKISTEELYDEFREWYKKYQNYKTVPKKPDVDKQLCKLLGNPKNNYYQKVMFNYNIPQDNKKNELD